jgi:GH24 family phage-related lysozyme (muramidase)
MAAKKKKAGAAAAAAGAGGANPAAAHAAGAPAKPARPCGTCDPTLPYSLSFKITDSNGKLCDRMYYTVKYKNSGEVYTESTQGDSVVTEQSLGKLGLTLRYYTSDASEEIFLYIGHRTAADLYPETRTGTENTYDEAPLHHDTVAPTVDKKVSDAQTQRLWKPWAFSDHAAQDSINNWERRRAYVYDDASPSRNWTGGPNTGTLTIGIGHALTPAEAQQYLRRFPTGGPGMPDAEMDQLFAQDVNQRARQAGLNEEISVPLYQAEFDALVDLRFNAGGGSGSSDAATDFRGGFNPNSPNARVVGAASIRQLLNRGRYTAAGDRILSTANSVGGAWHRGVQNRRNFQNNIFFGR